MSAVDHAPALYGGTFQQRVHPALNMLVFPDAEELRSAIGPSFDQSAVPGKNGDVGDRISVAGDVFVVGKTSVQYIELALGFHGETIDGVFDFDRRVGVEMSESTADVRC